MIGIFFSRRKKADPEPVISDTMPSSPADFREAVKRQTLFFGGVPEKTQDFETRQAGERIGFRKPSGWIE